MPFTTSTFVEKRRYAYHLTSEANLPSITKGRRLHSAAVLMIQSGQEDLLQKHRCAHIRLTNETWLRDQAPLHEKNVAFLDGWTLADLIEALNRRVFFWPGGAAGPNDYGVRHFERYRREAPILLRVTSSDLLAANPDREPQFCRFNSGSPRYSGGRPSPRGPETFTPPKRFRGSSSEVVELTFVDGVCLPDTTERGSNPSGPWSPLFPSAGCHQP